MYLNTSDFSSNAYGIKVAAETYFGKQPDSLNLEESAVLVGMLQAHHFTTRKEIRTMRYQSGMKFYSNFSNMVI